MTFKCSHSDNAPDPPKILQGIFILKYNQRPSNMRMLDGSYYTCTYRIKSGSGGYRVTLLKLKNTANTAELSLLYLQMGGKRKGR